MESGAMEMDATAAPDTGEESECSIACLRRRAWAQSRDSIWQKSEQERCGPQGPQQSQSDGDTQRPSEEPGRVPNNITNWLIECRTPLGASLDDQSASPNRGALRNGCSFEDDLSLGAEANHLQSNNNKAEPHFGLAADQKRSQYKERGRSMNSTGSGKSSTVSSVSEVLEQSEDHPEEILLTLCVSELLDLYEEDPEEILLNLGFGREEPDLASKVPSRFFNNSSTARGIDIKVYLGAQLQRMELENPNYALTSRFRQIEVLTTVANEFFQLYSQVSGQPVQRISSRDQGGEVGEGGGDEPPPLKRNSSALNVAKFLKKTISKHNLLANAPESPEAHTQNQHAQVNGHAPPDHTHTNGHAHARPEQNGCSTDLNHQGETVSQKHVRKKESCLLATVTEESNGDGETDRLSDNSPAQSGTGPAANGESQTESADLQTANERTEEGAQVVEEEKNLTSTPEKAPPTLAPPQLAQLRTENADSFDMEEIQSNDDEGLPSRTSRANDLLRTVSQQSDSSGFAEEPSADSNSYLKVQESSDSCDSETTVTSHPSQDVATPHALDQPVFNLPDVREEEVLGPGGATEADGRSGSRKEEAEHDGSSVKIPQYTAHQLPKKQQDEGPAENGGRTDPETEPQPETEMSHSASEQESQHTQNQTETTVDTKPTTVGVGAEDEAQEENASLDGSALASPLTPSSPVLSALNRAKQYQLNRGGLTGDHLLNEMPQTQGRGRGRRGIPLQRSSSLPSSLLSPSRVVSSVRIQFGRGQSSCTKPKFSFKYNQEAGEDKKEEDSEKEDKEVEEEEQNNCLSTLIINPSSSSGSNSQTLRLPKDSPIPPKPIPRYLLRSSSSLQSPSPPPDWSPGGHVHSWSTQSVPDLSSSQQLPGHFQQNLSTSQTQQSWNRGPVTFSYPNHNPADQSLTSSPNPSPIFNNSPYPYNLTPHQQYPSPLHPYTSLPNLHHNHSLNHHSSLTSLHQPTPPTVPQHGSLSNLHQPPTSTAPHHSSMGNLHTGSPIMHHQGYSHPYNHQSPYYAAPHGSQFASPYMGYHGYNMNPTLGFPRPVTQCPLIAPEHGLHPGLTPAAPGFLPGFSQGHCLHPGLTPPAAPDLGPGHGPSSTEMQLRRVLHEIRGTVQSLSQSRVNTPDTFSEHRAGLSSHQSLTEFQQKRRSLNLFRSQMMDLELSIIRQQALVYKHLSPADRMEVEQLQSLRSAVREELQELEQQLEDRLLELTHTQQRGLHRDSSVDSLSAASALRAMEPVSDLLREQLFLQSELSYDGHALSTNPSSRASSPVRGREGDNRQGVYKASINITPAPPPRPSTHKEEEGEQEEEEGKRDSVGGGGREGGEEGGEEAPVVEGAAGGGVRVENLHQLIREIRESVAQEVRREIYSELLAAVSPRQSPLPTKQQRL